MSETIPAGEASDARPPSGDRRGAEAFAPFFCLVGLCVAAYLTAMHFGLLTGDLALGEACGPGGDCNSVVASRYGMLLGLPVSVWGMWFYIVAGVLTTASLLLRREDAAPYLRATVRLTGVALAFDAWLAYAMFARIGRFCPLCVATYAVNLLILIVTLPAARRAASRRCSRACPPSGGPRSPPTTARCSSSSWRASAWVGARSCCS